MKNILLVTLILLSSLKVSAQADPNTIIPLKSEGISFGLAGGPQAPLGLSYDLMLTKKTSIEIGAGILAGGLSFRFFLTDPTMRRFNYYVQPNFMIYYSIPTAMYYLPLGISYHSKNNLQYSFDAGIMYTEAFDPSLSPYAGAKIGYRFGKDFGTEKTTIELDKKNYISLSLGATTPMAGIIYERILNNYFGIEAGIGVISAGLGAKIYPFQLKKENISIHLGATHSFFAFVFVGDLWLSYFPIGFDYITEKNLRFSIDAGPMMEWYTNIGSTYDLYPSLNLRIGKGF